MTKPHTAKKRSGMTPVKSVQLLSVMAMFTTLTSVTSGADEEQADSNPVIFSSVWHPGHSAIYTSAFMEESSESVSGQILLFKSAFKNGGKKLDFDAGTEEPIFRCRCVRFTPGRIYLNEKFNQLLLQTVHLDDTGLGIGIYDIGSKSIRSLRYPGSAVVRGRSIAPVLGGRFVGIAESEEGGGKDLATLMDLEGVIENARLPLPRGLTLGDERSVFPSGVAQAFYMTGARAEISGGKLALNQSILRFEVGELTPQLMLTSKEIKVRPPPQIVIDGQYGGLTGVATVDSFDFLLVQASPAEYFVQSEALSESISIKTSGKTLDWFGPGAERSSLLRLVFSGESQVSIITIDLSDRTVASQRMEISGRVASVHSAIGGAKSLIFELVVDNKSRRTFRRMPLAMD